MAIDYHHIGFGGLEIASPVTWEMVERFVSETGLPAGSTALDIGAGTGGVSVSLAKRFGFRVHAIERAPLLADLTRERASVAGVSDRVTVITKHSAEALAEQHDAELIVAMGTTDAAGNNARQATDIFVGLAPRLADGGFLLWGDMVWIAQPPPQLVDMVARSGVFASDIGWKQAAGRAGLDCVASEITPQHIWDDFMTGVDGRVRTWLAANPEHRDAGNLTAHADLTKSVLDAARPYLRFGLYLFQKAPSAQ